MDVHVTQLAQSVRLGGYKVDLIRKGLSLALAQTLKVTTINASITLVSILPHLHKHIKCSVIVFELQGKVEKVCSRSYQTTT